MQRQTDNEFDRVVILLFFALFLLLSPLRDWWAADESPWYAPYIVWAVIIGIAMRLQRRRERRDL